MRLYLVIEESHQVGRLIGLGWCYIWGQISACMVGWGWTPYGRMRMGMNLCPYAAV